MPVIDLTFDLQGKSIPLDYGYALFGAISGIVPSIHGDRRIGVHPIRGIKAERGSLALVPQSRLRLRMPSEEIGTYLPLAGARLDLGGATIRVGLPRAEPLVSSAKLSSRLVTIGRGLTTPEPFLESLRRQLDAMGVAGTLGLPSKPDPNVEGNLIPLRRILRVKAAKMVGFAVAVSGLTAEESLILQEAGLGSRRRMGCGVMVPV